MPSKLGDVNKLPTSNELGNVGESQNNAQHLQNTRQHSANYRSAQTQYPNTPAGQDAYHAWNQRNPAPVKQDLNQQQQNVQNYVDQELVARGAGPGFAHAQARLQGQKPVAPQRAEADQHAEHNRVMADIKREQANGGIQNSRVNTVNPSKRVDISGERRRIEKENNWPAGSMDQGGANYAANGPRSAQLVQQNGPTGIPQAPVAAPTPSPVAQTTPPPAQPWKSKEAEKMYNDSVNKPNSGYNGNINMGGGSLGGAAAQRPKITSLPGGQQSTAELQASGQMAPRPAGRYGMTDEQWFNTPEGQKQAQSMKETHQKLFGVPDLEGSLDVQNKNSEFVGPDNPLGLPAPDVNFTPKDPPAPPAAPKPIWNDPGEPEKLNSGLPLMRGGENLLAIKPKGMDMPKPPTIKPNPSFAPQPQRTPIRPIAPPSSGLKGSITPKPTPKPVEGVNKMPTIKKSSPITDTIKALNTPIPEVNTNKPAQQPTAQRKPLFPRLGGRLRR